MSEDSKAGAARRKSKFFPSQTKIKPNPDLIQQSLAKFSQRKSKV
jgi:hypothetical protein